MTDQQHSIDQHHPSASSSPPRTPPNEPDDETASFNRSTRSQIRLKVTHRYDSEEGHNDDGDQPGTSLSDEEDDDGQGVQHWQHFNFASFRDDDDDDDNEPASGDASDPLQDAENGEIITGQSHDSMARRKVRLRQQRDWDDSEDEDNDDDEDDDDDDNNRTRRRNQQQQQQRNTSYARTFTPSRHRRRSFWLYLTNPGAPNSLSIPHVAANLFSASLHPSVLLSTPFYFDRTGILLGTIGLVLVAFLGGVGGGLWAVLSRYVGGKKTVEAITGASFGRNTKWKGSIGKAVAGVLLGLYATGSAFIAYFAIADLLLQVFFHYSPRGIPLHDRGFVTLVVGGLFTAPLIIVPLAKRTLIRLATWTALFFYPAVMIILFVKIYTIDPDQAVLPSGRRPDQTIVSSGHDRHSLPNGNPLHPPSIWAPYSLLPLLTLSSSPLQILAHNRSLRRKASKKGAQHSSNVKAFLGAQAIQVIAVILVVVAFGIGMGTKGISERLGANVHPNLFATLPQDDHLINLARILFVLVLSTHLALCLAVARSSWARLLKLFHLNPFKWSRRTGGQIRLEGQTGESSNGHHRRRQWGKLARTSFGGLLLWLFVSVSAFISGVGGIRRSEKAGEEARYVRCSEILGLLGGGVGFALPALVWIILFHIRQPRTILPEWVSDRAKGMSVWVRGELGNLSKRNTNSTTSTNTPGPISLPLTTDDDNTTQSGNNERGGDDSATRILLARKERQLQKRTKERRLWQDILVLAAVLPCGIVLLCFGAIELSKGGY
ncbi:unnamed protein product [Sympodiomycopsis kandeliae]